VGDVLIVGCGYLGRRVAGRLSEAGRRVLATTRSAARAEEFRAAGLVPIVCDVTDPATLGGLPAVDTVIHAVGLDRSAGKSMHEVYVAGLANLLDGLPPPRRFVLVSSTSVYGQTSGEVVDEGSPTEPAEESGRTVLEAERVLRGRFPEAIVLRFAGIYGPGRLLRRVQSLQAREPIAGDPERWLNLIHVEDGAAAVLAAAERGRPGGVYVVCDDRPVRRREFFTLLARELNAPPPVFVPAAPGQPRESANRRTSNRRLREELGVALRYPDCAAGLRAACGEASSKGAGIPPGAGG
jgi:nucleoside-diphosphate-sugar epimerase